MAINEHHYQRIDKGTKRDYRALARRQPRTNKGTFGLIHDPEKRKAAILDALDSLPFGEPTNQIAARHGIPGPTLRAWLLAEESLPAEIARNAFMSSELSLRVQDIDEATDPLSLARAREAFRAWSWIAERRNAKFFGPKQEVTHTLKPEFNVILKQADTVIEGQSVPVLDSPSK